MKKRKIKKAFKRLRYLPGGMNFFRYSTNKVRTYTNKFSKSLKVVYPSTIMLEVTNYCNLHCITCPREYQYGKQMDIGHMDINLLKKVIDQTYPYIDSVGLTGLGEPLLYKHLPEALDYIKSKNKGIITSLSTNASLGKTPELIAQIKQNIDTIQISIDGIGETYNKVRINGDYDKFLLNVKDIKKQVCDTDTDVTLNMVVVKENYHQITEMIELTQSLGFQNLSFTLFNLASVTDIGIEYYDLFYSNEFKAELKKARQKANTVKNVDVSFWDYESENGFNKCPFPWSHFYISWDGYLPPCCAKPFPKELSFGDLNKSGLIDCLNSKEFQNFRSLWYKNITPGFCKKCHFTDLKAIKI